MEKSGSLIVVDGAKNDQVLLSYIRLCGSEDQLSEDKTFYLSKDGGVFDYEEAFTIVTGPFAVRGFCVTEDIIVGDGEKFQITAARNDRKMVVWAESREGLLIITVKK